MSESCRELTPFFVYLTHLTTENDEILSSNRMVPVTLVALRSKRGG